MSLYSLRRIGTAALLAACASPAAAESMSLGASNDTWIRDGFSHAANGVDPVLDWRLSFVPYIQFDLSGLPIETVSDATLTITKVPGNRNDTIVNTRFATYGVPNLPGNTAQGWHEVLDFDPLDATNGLDFRNVGAEHTLNTGDGVDRGLVVSLDPEDGVADVTETFTPVAGATSGETTITLTGAALVSFLNDRVSDGGLVTFVFPFEQANRGAGIASKENANPDFHPRLDLVYTVVPEPATLVLGSLAGLALAGFRRR